MSNALDFKGHGSLVEGDLNEIIFLTSSDMTIIGVFFFQFHQKDIMRLFFCPATRINGRSDQIASLHNFFQASTKKAERLVCSKLFHLIKVIK